MRKYPTPSHDVKPYALSPLRAAVYLDCSRQYIYNLMADGRLPSTKIGRSRRIKVSDLEALLDGGADQ